MFLDLHRLGAEEENVAFYGWDTCRESTKRQVGRLLSGLRNRLGDDLTGLYLHGSLAMGCFNPATSDIDLLAVVSRGFPRSLRESLARFLLSLSGSPHPVEISFLRPEDLTPWRHPSPFEFHYSEGWRKRFERDLAAGSWNHLRQKSLTDPDLAAHITVLRARGIRLAGKSIRRIFPAVPRRDYLASIVADLHWAQKRSAKDPVYVVLNACRGYAFLRDGGIYSKAEGAARARRILPAEFHPAIAKALAAYRAGTSAARRVDPGAVKRLLAFVISAAEAGG